MRKQQYLVLDEDSNIIWSGLRAPTDAIMRGLKTMLPEASFSTFAVHHVVNLQVPACAI